MHCKPLQRDPVLVIRDEQGKLDAVVAEGCDLHIEQMDDETWWLSIEKNGHRHVAWFRGVQAIEDDRE